MPITKEQVLDIVKRKGPLIPAVIAKDLGLDLLFAQAFLSELSSHKQVMVSHIKVGGSPLYYVEGQEDKLQNFAERLNEKDKRTYDRLKEVKVLKDSDVDPLTRVCLRQIKDFAVMLEVRIDDQPQIFWKWYRSSNAEVEPVIKKMLGLDGSPQEKEPVKEEPSPEPEKETSAVEEPSQQSVAQDTGVKVDSVNEQSVQKSEEQRPVTPLPVRPKPSAQSRLTDSAEVEIETVDPLAEIKAAISEGDEFLGSVLKFFDDNKIAVSNHKIIRKNGDFEFQISVPTAVGPLDFYCKAKNKKKCNDGDMSSAYLQGQLKKLPILFLTTGELTKKAEEMLQKEFTGMKVQRL